MGTYMLTLFFIFVHYSVPSAKYHTLKGEQLNIHTVSCNAIQNVFGEHSYTAILTPFKM